MSENVVDNAGGPSKDFIGTVSSSLGYVDAEGDYAPASPTNIPKKKKTLSSYCIGIISVVVILSGAAALSLGLFTKTTPIAAQSQPIPLAADTELLLGDKKSTLDEETHPHSHSSHLRRGTPVNRGLDECNCELIRHRRTLLEEGLAEKEQDSMMSMDI